MVDGNGNVIPDIELLLPWLPLTRFIRRNAQQANGKLTVLTVRVLLDENTKPAKWTMALSCLEPRGGIGQLLELMGDE